MLYKIVSNTQKLDTLSVDVVIVMIKDLNSEELLSFYKAVCLNKALAPVVTEAYERVFCEIYRNDPEKRGAKHLIDARREDEMHARLLGSILTEGACIARRAREGHTKILVEKLATVPRSKWEGFSTLLPETSALSPAIEHKDYQVVPILLAHMTPDQIFRKEMGVCGTALHDAVRAGDVAILRQVLAKARNAEDINFAGAHHVGNALAYARHLNKPEVEAVIREALARFESIPGSPTARL